MVGASGFEPPTPRSRTDAQFCRIVRQFGQSAESIRLAYDPAADVGRLSPTTTVSNRAAKENPLSAELRPCARAADLRGGTRPASDPHRITVPRHTRQAPRCAKRKHHGNRCCTDVALITVADRWRLNHGVRDTILVQDRQVDCRRRGYIAGFDYDSDRPRCVDRKIWKGTLDWL